MRHEFATPQHVELHVELGVGRLEVGTHDPAQVVVEIAGERAEEFTVTQEGGRITVLAPRDRVGFLGSSVRHRVLVRAPHGTDLVSRTGSADVTVEGRLGSCRIKAGSGDVRVAEVTSSAVLETGSGSIGLRQAGADLRIKAGSGDVHVDRVAGTVVTSTGSGSVRIGSAAGAAVLKAGSGCLVLDTAGDETTMTTGSGDITVTDLRRGRLTAKAASGDITLGIRAGTPVWTDIRTVSGAVRSGLTPVGAPAEGQESVEVRVTTASGDVSLRPL